MLRRKRFAACLAVSLLSCAGAWAQQPAELPMGTSQAPQFTPSAPSASSPSAQVVATPARTAVKAAQSSLQTPQEIVGAVIAMFTPDLTVNLEATGKPLPLSGSWGLQSQFPAGPPRACVLAQIQCVKVVYRLPEAKIVCEWTVGLAEVSELQADGTRKRAIRDLVLEENEAAAHYTLRKAWETGESKPRMVAFERPEYPEIARRGRADGVVQVRVEVGPDGLVRKAVASSGPPMLRNSVVAAARHWRFDPLRIGDRTTGFELDEEISFTLPKADTMAGMDPSGQVVIPETDPHRALGFRSNGASSGGWSSCTAATGCTSVAPNTPK